jgi:hypothetical protein
MSLAETGYAPPIFAYVDKAGRPLWALVAMLLFGLLAYINLSARGPLVFNWLLALGGLSTLFTWGTICLAHIRFRAAWRAQGHSLEELPFRAMCGVWGSWTALILVLLVLVAQFYVALDPVRGASRDPRQVASAFFQAYLALPVVLLFYVVGYAWKRTTPRRAHQIDLDVSRSFSLPFCVSDDHFFFGVCDRPAGSAGTPSNRCGSTSPNVPPSQYGRRPTASFSPTEIKRTSHTYLSFIFYARRTYLYHYPRCINSRRNHIDNKGPCESSRVYLKTARDYGCVSTYREHQEHPVRVLASSIFATNSLQY